MHAIRYGTGEFKGDGPMPRHRVVTHRKVNELLGIRSDGKLKGICYPDDGNSCKNDVRKLPPVYKLSSGTSLPALMVSPETLYDLVEQIPKDSTPSQEYRKENSRVSLAIEPLIRSVSYMRSQDIVKDSLMRVKKSCRDPDLQGVSAQEDCDSRIEALTQSKVNLDVRAESDRKHLMAQSEFYSEVEKMKNERVRIKQENSSPNKSHILEPLNIK
jgi:hypothetical protein